MAKFLWICLKSYASKTSPNPFPGRHTLCQMMGIGVGAFKKYRAELESNGWLEREDRRREGGLYFGSIYTLTAPEICKQNLQRGVEKRTPVKRTPDYRTPDNRPPKDHQSEDPHKKKTTTTTEGAAFAASGRSEPAPQAGAAAPGPRQEADALIRRWSELFQKWFGIPYRSTIKDRKSAEEVFSSFEHARVRDLVYVACSMWNLTREKEAIDDEIDPLFFNFKGQRSIDFFCRHLEKIINEQEDSVENVLGKITAKEMQDEEATIGAGRGN